MTIPKHMQSTYEPKAYGHLEALEALKVGQSHTYFSGLSGDFFRIAYAAAYIDEAREDLNPDTKFLFKQIQKHVDRKNITVTQIKKTVKPFESLRPVVNDHKAFKSCGVERAPGCGKLLGLGDTCEDPNIFEYVVTRLQEVDY